MDAERPARTPDVQEGPIFCPKCKKEAVKTMTTFGRRDDCKDCDLWSWKGKPLVDRATHAARRKAHDAFDLLWKKPSPLTVILQFMPLDKADAYVRLAEELGVPEPEAHMHRMSSEEAEKVPRAVARVLRKVL